MQHEGTRFTITSYRPMTGPTTLMVGYAQRDSFINLCFKTPHTTGMLVRSLSKDAAIELRDALTAIYPRENPILGPHRYVPTTYVPLGCHLMGVNLFVKASEVRSFFPIGMADGIKHLRNFIGRLCGYPPPEAATNVEKTTPPAPKDVVIPGPQEVDDHYLICVIDKDGQPLPAEKPKTFTSFRQASAIARKLVGKHPTSTFAIYQTVATAREETSIVLRDI